MNKQEISVLLVLDRMVKDDDHGIQMSKTIADVKFVPQGSIIGFGVQNNIGEDANFQITTGFPGEYMIFCLAVKRTELDKTRTAIMQEQFEQQQSKYFTPTFQMFDLTIGKKYLITYTDEGRQIIDDNNKPRIINPLPSEISE